MANKSPEQIIFDTVYRVSQQLGYATYTYLPAEKVDYPFVFIGESVTVDRHTKTGVFGDIAQTVHVYHSYKKRNEITTMLNRIKYTLYGIKRAEGLHLKLNRGNVDLLLDDTTTPEVLLHGVLDLEFTFNY